MILAITSPGLYYHLTGLILLSEHTSVTTSEKCQLKINQNVDLIDSQKSIHKVKEKIVDRLLKSLIALSIVIF